MRTLKINTFKQFKDYDCPYFPRVTVSGKLVISNFAVNPNNAMRNKARLIVTQILVYNRGGFAAAFYANVSRFGPQLGWCYFVDGRKVTWRQLTWEQKRKVAKAFVKLPQIDFMRPPVKTYKRWATL